MFRDMTKRHKTGFCTYAGGLVSGRSVNVYTAGWVCKDRSAMNTHCPKPLQEQLTTDSGQSTATLHASIEYIETFEPDCVILENTFRLTSIAIALKLVRACGSGDAYAAHAYKVNARAFGNAAGRTRIYIIAVNTKRVTVVTPMREWAEQLEAMAAAMPANTVEESLLPDNHPEVLKVMGDMLRRASAKSGRAWSNCEKYHRAVRKWLAEQHHVHAPSPRQMKHCARKGSGSDWLRTLTDREIDVLNVHAYAAKHLLNVDVASCKLCWDLTNDITFGLKKDARNKDTMECMLRTHKIWHTQRQRVIIGRERMAAQGFRNIRTTDGDGKEVVTDAVLTQLSGDTMAVPVVGAFIAVLLANVVTNLPSHGQTVAELQRGLPDLGDWIGSRTFGIGSKFDRLGPSRPRGSRLLDQRSGKRRSPAAAARREPVA